MVERTLTCSVSGCWPGEPHLAHEKCGRAAIARLNSAVSLITHNSQAPIRAISELNALPAGSITDDTMRAFALVLICAAERSISSMLNTSDIPLRMTPST